MLNEPKLVRTEFRGARRGVTDAAVPLLHTRISGRSTSKLTYMTIKSNKRKLRRAQRTAIMLRYFCSVHVLVNTTAEECCSGPGNHESIIPSDLEFLPELGIAALRTHVVFRV